MVKLNDKAVGLKERNELCGEHIFATSWVKPTNKGLHAVDSVVCNVVLRLNEGTELVILKSRFHHSLDLIVTSHAAANLLVEHGEHLVSVLRVMVGCGVCALHHLVNRSVTVLINVINTNVKSQLNIFAGEDLVSTRYGGDKVNLILQGMVGNVVNKHYEAAVTKEGIELILRDKVLKELGNKSEKLKALFLADLLVEVKIIMNREYCDRIFILSVRQLLLKTSTEALAVRTLKGDVGKAGCGNSLIGLSTVKDRINHADAKGDDRDNQQTDNVSYVGQLGGDKTLGCADGYQPEVVAELLNGRVGYSIVFSTRTDNIRALGITENGIGQDVGIILVSGYTVDVVKEVVACGNGLSRTRRIGIYTSALVNKNDNVGLILANVVKADHVSGRNDGQNAVNEYRATYGHEEGNTGCLNIGVLVYVGTAGCLGLGKRSDLLIGADLGLNLVAVYRIGLTLGVVTEAAEFISANVASHNLINLFTAVNVLKSLGNVIEVIVMHLRKVANRIDILIKGKDSVLLCGVVKVLGRAGNNGYKVGDKDDNSNNKGCYAGMRKQFFNQAFLFHESRPPFPFHFPLLAVLALS